MGRSKVGTCHICGIWGIKLTYEHIPPLRVQKLVAAEHSRINPLALMQHHGQRQRRLPPAKVFPGGMGNVAQCEVCQQRTAASYGQAFYDWSVQCFRYADKAANEDSVLMSLRIRPLNVIKQIATMALAAAPYNPISSHHHLRRFVLNEHVRYAPREFEFYAYLNPVREEWELPQTRMEAHAPMVANVVKGSAALVLAEIAFPPLGYLVLYRLDALPLAAQATALTPISYFGDAANDEESDVFIRLPIRTPFGPMPTRYWQDAVKETHLATAPDA